MDSFLYIVLAAAIGAALLGHFGVTLQIVALGMVTIGLLIGVGS